MKIDYVAVPVAPVAEEMAAREVDTARWASIFMIRIRAANEGFAAACWATGNVVVAEDVFAGGHEGVATLAE